MKFEFIQKYKLFLLSKVVKKGLETHVFSAWKHIAAYLDYLSPSINLLRLPLLRREPASGLQAAPSFIQGHQHQSPRVRTTILQINYFL